MQANTVVIDPTDSSIRFAPRFNVAVPFIDRHPAEGRVRRRLPFARSTAM